MLMILGICISLFFTITSFYWRKFDIFNFLVSLIEVLFIILSFKIDPIITKFKK